MTSGTVKFFNNAKASASSPPTTDRRTWFVHISAVERAGLATLAENQKVSFELERGTTARSPRPPLGDLTSRSEHGVPVLAASGSGRSTDHWRPLRRPMDSPLLKRKHLAFRDLHGIHRLASDATVGITNLVEA